MITWYTLVRGRETMRVRERGLQTLLDQGWQILGANPTPEQPKTAQAQSKTRKKNNVND